MIPIRDFSAVVTVSAKRKSGQVQFAFIIMAALSLALASLIASPLVQAGALDNVVTFDIEPTTLDHALLEFGAQEHMQIMFEWNSSTASQRTNQLKGSYTGKDALAQILHGTPLTYIGLGKALEILPHASVDSSSARRNRKSLDAQRSENSKTSNDSVSGNLDPPLTSRHSQVSQPTQVLGEVFVTAQKYRQDAFDVPINLDVISGQELQRFDITSLNELQYDVPGLYVEGANRYQYIVLRGVSNQAGNGALVGEYIDEADISADGYVGQTGYAGSVQLYDLERVEVLKGPQGTLYGDGAMGGVIRYVTKKPEMARDEMSADVSTLFTQQGAPSQHIDTMLNAPLISGVLGVRIAGQFQHDGGWVDEPAANLKNINDGNSTDVRMEAQWQPTMCFKALATQVVHRDSYGIGEGEDAYGNITPVFGVTSPPNGEQSSNISNLTMTADLATAQLLSSTTYLTHAETIHNEVFALPTEDVLDNYLPIASQTFNQELRLHSGDSGNWRWTLGGFYKRYTDDDAGSEYFGIPGALSTASHYVVLGNTEQSKSKAAFADTSIRLFNRLTLGAGVRYFRSRFSAETKGNVFNDVLLIPPNSANAEFASTDPRVYVQYVLTSDVNMFISAAKGFRSGEPNIGLFKGFNPESLWSYDFGTKMRLLEGRLRSDIDVFLEDYSDYVGEGLINVYGIPLFGTFNIGDARIKGIDADIAWWVSGRWRFSAKGEIVDSKFVSISAEDTGFAPGERVPLVPGYTFMLAVEREFDVSAKPAFAQINCSQTARIQGTVSPVIDSDVIRFLNFKTGVQLNRNASLAFFAQNILNDRGYLDPNWNDGYANRPRPRTFGVEYAVSFE